MALFLRTVKQKDGYFGSSSTLLLFRRDETALAGPRRPRAGLGEAVAVFRGHPSLTRSDVAEVTGLSRATVNQRLEALLSAGVIAPADARRRGAVGPPSGSRFNAARGILLLVDIGATGMRAALCDLSGSILQERFAPSAVTSGPEVVLPDVQRLFAQMLAATGHTPEEVEGIGLDVPGPVDFDAGLVISPPIMTGWDRYDIRGWFGRHYPCPVVVEKDANAMAFGEHRLVHPDVANMLYLKSGTGVGSGIIANGQIYRGADGAAGDIGHNQIPDPDERSRAAVPLRQHRLRRGLHRRLGAGPRPQAAGLAVTTVDEAVEAIKAGDPAAVRLARRAGPHPRRRTLRRREPAQPPRRRPGRPARRRRGAPVRRAARDDLSPLAAAGDPSSSRSFPASWSAVPASSGSATSWPTMCSTPCGWNRSCPPRFPRGVARCRPHVAPECPASHGARFRRSARRVARGPALDHRSVRTQE